MSADISAATIGAIAIIVASIIGFIVAVASAVIAKEQKVSEFRQAWIESLREDIAELVALTYLFLQQKKKVMLLIEVNATKEHSSLIQETILHQLKIMKDISKTTALIQLRLNTNNEHTHFMDGINDLYNSIESTDINISDSFTKLQIILKDSHLILKHEWERVKKGEKRFVRFRDFGELCLYAFITAFFVIFMGGAFT